MNKRRIRRLHNKNNYDNYNVDNPIVIFIDELNKVFYNKKITYNADEYTVKKYSNKSHRIFTHELQNNFLEADDVHPAYNYKYVNNSNTNNVDAAYRSSYDCYFDMYLDNYTDVMIDIPASNIKIFEKAKTIQNGNTYQFVFYGPDLYIFLYYYSGRTGPGDVYTNIYYTNLDLPSSFTYDVYTK